MSIKPGSALLKSTLRKAWDASGHASGELMRRYLPQLLLTSTLLSPTSLWALGLGEVRLNSALNQPFDAEIELLSPTTEELSSLKVGLAGNDVFSRYGIDRPAYLSSFDFSVSRTRDGRAIIKVRSNRSVTEPFVTLLVEASWARGRLVREYTLLLDPPVFMPSQSQAPAPVTTPQAGAQTEGRITRPGHSQNVPHKRHRYLHRKNECNKNACQAKPPKRRQRNALARSAANTRCNATTRCGALQAARIPAHRASSIAR
jgi:Tfp pilus assembly protein FimV